MADEAAGQVEAFQVEIQGLFIVNLQQDRTHPALAEAQEILPQKIMPALRVL